MLALLGLLVVTVFWVFVEYDVIKRKYTNSNNISKQAKRNNQWLKLITGFCFIALYVTFFISWESDSLFYLSYIGSLIAFAGILLRRIAIQTLGKHFDGLVQLKKEQELIQHGLYRYIRHPSYTGTIITFLGFGIASMSIVNTILFPSLYTVCYYFRIKFEEEILIQGFGDKYKEYKMKTWSLLPWIGKQKNIEKKSNGFS